MGSQNKVGRCSADGDARRSPPILPRHAPSAGRSARVGPKDPEPWWWISRPAGPSARPIMSAPRALTASLTRPPTVCDAHRRRAGPAAHHHRRPCPRRHIRSAALRVAPPATRRPQSVTKRATRPPASCLEKSTVILRSAGRVAG